MAMELKIPSLGESVSEGTIARWVKADGDIVGPDDVVLELETDKARFPPAKPVAWKSSCRPVKR